MKRHIPIFILNFSLIIYSFIVEAQTARKPSYYENKAKQQLVYSTNHAISKKNGLTQSIDNYFLPTIDNNKTFQALARTYELGTLYEIPHVLFIIDLQDHNKIYYLNTPIVELHENFIQTFLVKEKLTRTQLNQNYTNPKRRFLLGTVSWQNAIKGFSYEYWEGDLLSKNFLDLTEQILQNTFYAPIVFKTNSTEQEHLAKAAKIKFITQQQLIKEQPFLALNKGQAKGQIYIIETDQDLTNIKPTDIVVLRNTPISLPPVAAIISEQPSTVLSHINLLAKSLGIPNAYIKHAVSELKSYQGQWIEIKITDSNYTVTKITEPDKVKTIPPIKVPKVNTTDFTLFTLKQLRQKNAAVCGNKAANLGEINNLLPSANVPDGFCIPFGYYEQFMQQHRLWADLKQLEENPSFQANPKFRQQALAQFRQKIINMPIKTNIRHKWQIQWNKQLANKPVFIRSSSNSEDLQNFNGAGLYTSVPNINNHNEFINAIKQVWASLFNYEAYETRRNMNIPHHAIKMSVLVQLTIDADKSGVLITRDPFDTTRPYITYIAAKRGLGMKVVEGQAIAEQIMYSSWSKAIQVLTLSEETTALRGSEQGGVIETKITSSQPILDKKLITELASLGQAIKYIFHHKDQDIEWAEKQGKIYILQARTYIH